MSAPRQILSGKFYLLTRNCAQRQFLLRPDSVTWQIFAYCLALAAKRLGIFVILSLAMSNHHHTVLYDPTGMICKFMEYFHGLVARAMNAFRGRSENFWSSEQPSLVELADVEDVIARLVYTATNPVKDGLVSESAHWPGFNGLAAFYSGKPIEVQRPAHYFSDEMPGAVTLEMTIPPQLGAPERIRSAVRRGVAAVEAACAKERRETGKRVLGRGAVKKQAWWWAPTSTRERGAINPRFAAVSTELRLALIERHKAFQSDYRTAYRAWRAGDVTVVFPVGTYWLARFANARVAGAEKI